MAVTFTLTEEEKNILGTIACSTITSVVAGEQTISLPPPSLAEGSQGHVHEALGCFVTLTKGGHLRGCIGNMVGQEALYLTVARMAHAAAMQDHRFPPVTQEEWQATGNKRIDIEISVLGPLSPCPGKEHIEVGTHGLLLQLHGKSGVFLPKVPVEQGWDLDTYLTQLCRKAALPDGSWQHPQAQLFWYEALVFAVQRS